MKYMQIYKNVDTKDQLIFYASTYTYIYLNYQVYIYIYIGQLIWSKFQS